MEVIADLFEWLSGQSSPSFLVTAADTADTEEAEE